MAIRASQFDYDAIPAGYYQEVVDKGTAIRRAWHLQKFGRVIDCLPQTPGQSILDVGCFAGTFLSLLPEETFSTQVGVDILPKQVDYANKRFGTRYRRFRHISDVSQLCRIEQQFDCITMIELIEHLSEAEIRELFQQVNARLKVGGRLVVTSPNYLSLWPFLEIIVNRLSDVSYAEQHLTKLNYFTCVSRMQRMSRVVAENFELVKKTTTHFVEPFLAKISFAGSMWLSKMFFRTWKNPFGSIILLSFRKGGEGVLGDCEDLHRIIHGPETKDGRSDVPPSHLRKAG